MLAAFVWSADAEELLFKMRMAVGIETNEAGVVSVIARMALENQTDEMLQLVGPGFLKVTVFGPNRDEINPTRIDTDGFMAPMPKLGPPRIRPGTPWLENLDLSDRFAFAGPGQYVVTALWKASVASRGTNLFRPPVRVEAHSEHVVVTIPEVAIRPPPQPFPVFDSDEYVRKNTRPIPDDASPETRAFIEKNNRSLTNLMQARKAYLARFQTQEVVTANPDTNVMAPPEPAPSTPPVAEVAAPSDKRWPLIVIAGIASIMAAFVLLRRKRG